jgi:alkanesulfonate monooxygenase SsuD/methylene tetrahydromethanopterin reductase-like flavin-dependent oxidoreductase (luciferase family)
MAVTLDHITAGRAILGVGAGWHAEEHRMFGVPLPPAPVRIDALEQTVHTAAEVLVRRGSVETTALLADDTHFEPEPVRKRIPILIGGSSARVKAIAAAHADVLNTFTDASGWPALNAELDALLDTHGREPQDLVRSAYVFADISGDGDREHLLTALVAERNGISVADAQARVVVADAERAQVVLSRLFAAGVDEVVLGLSAPYDPCALERFAADVMPLLVEPAIDPDPRVSRCST